MSIDTSRVGELLAAQMEAVEADYLGNEDAEITEAAIVIEVRDGEMRRTRVRCSSDSAATQVGLLQMGISATLCQTREDS